MADTVIYTAIFGGKDKLHRPLVLPSNCDFVVFDDASSVSSDPDPVRAAKMYKILPHRFFPQYEYSVWIDGNIFVRGDVNELIEQYLHDTNIALFSHANNVMDPCDSVYVEGEYLIMRAEKGKSKDDPGLIRTQMQNYKKEGFPDRGGLVVGMEIVRRHNEPDVKEAMEAWWHEIQTHSKRDQLSFNYVAWKQNLKFAYMDGDSRDNRYFVWKPHQR